MERMGHVTYEFEYQVALECLRAKYPDLYVEEDPFVDYPENTNVQIEGSDRTISKARLKVDSLADVLGVVRDTHNMLGCLFTQVPFVATSIMAMVASWNLTTFGGRPSGARVEASFANASGCEVSVQGILEIANSEMKSTIAWALITVLGCIVAKVSSADEFAAFLTGAPGEVMGPHPRVAIGSRATPVRVRPPAVLLGRFVVVVLNVASVEGCRG
ncbi:hypothetical protein B296_00021396 [Ensete ventricosum]|uniref:Uncharacterized protein n=1 Tax=Ensete ventricosum TaxID=4639 RepID=A0A427ADF5_ENSVE|nr:hypothetical protein B296_00021396 [Ensete ventricosum]